MISKLRRRHRPLALMASMVAVFAMATTAFAYGPQVVTSITVTPASGTFLCERPSAVSATVLDQDGKPIKGVTVTWSFAVSPSSADRILQMTSKTDKHGIARTMVKLACVAGDRVIRATAGGVSGTAVIHVSLDRLGGPRGGVLGATGRPLPNTTTTTAVPDAVPSGSPSPIVPMILLALVGAVLVVRRSFSRR